jgi:hypothetical protein
VKKTVGRRHRSEFRLQAECYGRVRGHVPPERRNSKPRMEIEE